MNTARQRLLQILGAVEAMRLQHIGNAPVEAPRHPVGLGRAGSGESMLDAWFPAQPVKLMMAAGLLLAAGKQTIGERLAVVSAAKLRFR